MSALEKRSLETETISNNPFDTHNINITEYSNVVNECCKALAISDSKSDILKKKIDLMFILEDDFYKLLREKGVTNFTPFCDYIEKLFLSYNVLIPEWYKPEKKNIVH